jgi:hypothetical protein
MPSASRRVLRTEADPALQDRLVALRLVELRAQLRKLAPDQLGRRHRLVELVDRPEAARLLELDDPLARGIEIGLIVLEICPDALRASLLHPLYQLIFG